jgi:PAS domain-containing protein
VARLPDGPVVVSIARDGDNPMLAFAEAMIEALPDIALLVRPDGCIDAANEIAARAFGRDVAALTGLRVDEVLPGLPALIGSRPRAANGAWAREQVAAASRHRSARAVSPPLVGLAGRRPDGTLLMLDGSVVRLTGDPAGRGLVVGRAGPPAQAAAVEEPVHEPVREPAEEPAYRTLARSAPVGLFQLDPEGARQDGDSLPGLPLTA